MLLLIKFVDETPCSNYILAIHIDTDEANAAKLQTGAMGCIGENQEQQ